MCVNLNDFELPVIISENSQYEERLYDILSSYIKEVEKSNIDCDCVERIKSNIDKIKGCLKNYYNADLRKAYECIETILCSYKDSPYIVDDINKNYAFRGCLAEDKLKSDSELNFFRSRDEIKKLDKEEMLHIPFKLRGLVGTCRFSIYGIPCIYLATTSFGCWIESNDKNFNTFQVSSIKIPNDLKVLNLCINQYFINGFMTDKSESECYHFLEIFPLVIATSFRVLEKDRKFKSEYIISQIVMQVCSALGIDGVAYFSKRISDYYAFPQAVNLAIAVPYNDNSCYWKRASDISLTDAQKISDFFNNAKKMENKTKKLKKKTYINKFWDGTNYFDENCSQEDEEDSDVVIRPYYVYVETDEREEIRYTDMIFSKFDDFIINQKFYNFADVIKSES